MKKLFIILTTVIVLLIAGLVILATVDFNRAGKDHIYVQVAGEGKKESFTTSDGAIYDTYWYTLLGYDETGKQIEVTFSARKQLKEGAFLKLYVKNENEVTSYDEVSVLGLPEAAKQQLYK